MQTYTKNFGGMPMKKENRDTPKNYIMNFT